MSKFRLRLKGRLYGGFAALVVLGLTLAVVAVWELSTIRTHVDRMSVLSDNVNRVLTISVHVQGIRRANLRYVYDSDEPSFKEAADRETTAIELLQTAAKTTRSEERRKQYNDVLGAMEKMRALRENLGAAVRGMAKGKAILFPVGDELTANVDKLIAAARASNDGAVAAAAADLESKILLVRVANWRFLAVHDAKGPVTFKTNVEKAQGSIAALEKVGLPGAVRTEIEPVKKSLATYKTAFETTSADLLRADEIYRRDLAPLAVESLDTLKTVETSLRRDSEATRATADSVIANTTATQEVVGGAVVLFACIISFLIARSIVGPLTSMTRAMGSLAAGDVRVEIPGRGNADEIGDMAKAVQVFKDNMIETERLRAEQVTIEAARAEQRKAEMMEFAHQFEQAIGKIVETVSSASTELEASAGTLSATATRAEDLSAAVSSASEEASANVQAVASATEELSSSVTEIARQVQESARIANDAVSQVRRTNERVSELSGAAARIGDVVELISAIAGQTNLLALNATIEAARAGEAGRGFAVVASEVKALAEQTAKATGEIGQQVSGIQAATRESVGSIKEISGIIERLSEISSTVAAAVEEQGAATQEISRNVQQAAHGTQQVSANITDVRCGAAETGSASTQVLSAARSLSADSNRLKCEVGKFLNSVRSA